MEKAKIRKKILKSRRRLSSDDLFYKSNAIREKFLGLYPYIMAHTIMTYVSFGNEVDTGLLIDCMFRDDKIVCVPDCGRRDNEMVSVRITSIEDLEAKRPLSAIREPKRCCREVIDSSAIDILVVPVVAFDSRGGRVGYGKGYYDKYLTGLDLSKVVGFAFDFQEVEGFEKEPHDIKIPTIITESRIVIST